jgi:hypothetical protein
LNAAYGNRKGGKGPGRYKTRSYIAWEKAADGMAMEAGMFRHGIRPLVHGPATLVLRLPMTMRGDVSNRIKCCEDWLVDRGFLELDDVHNQSVTSMRDPKLGRVDYCEVDISNAD